MCWELGARIKYGMCRSLGGMCCPLEIGVGEDGDSHRWCGTEMGTRLGDWILKMG